MLSVSRRNFLSFTAATAVATALSTQAAHAATATTPLNGNGLNSGILRLTPLADVTYVSPFAQAFTNNKVATFAPAPIKTSSDALVETTFTTAAPTTGGVYTRVLARRTADGRDYYSAVAYINNAGELALMLERSMNGRSQVIAQRVLPIRFTATPTTFDLALSVRGIRLVAQIHVAGHPVETLALVDNLVPFASTPQGVGTAFSSYAGRTVPNTHIVTATSARSGNWGEHRGALVSKGWGKMIFEDDFTTGAIDGTKWRVRDKDYVGYDSGVILKEAVTTTGETSAKLWLKKLSKSVTYRDGKRRDWATGYIDTIGKFSAENFRLEYRAKQPASTPEHIGAWGCIWLRPDNTKLLGEIDISESYGYHSGKSKSTINISNRSEGTVHYGQDPKNPSKKNALAPNLGQNLADEYHTWAVEKTPAGVRFFFDGIEYLFVSSNDPRYQAALPKGEKFNIRLCMQAGNTYWGGMGATTADCAIEVDYVRVWEYVG